MWIAIFILSITLIFLLVIYNLQQRVAELIAKNNRLMRKNSHLNGMIGLIRTDLYNKNLSAYQATAKIKELFTTSFADHK